MSNLWIAILVMFFPSFQAMAQIGDQKDSLRSLAGVTVTAITSGCEGVIENSQLKQDAEVKLRVAGITVTPLPIATLKVNVHCLDVTIGSRTFGKAILLDLALSQIVWLPPQPVRVALGTTWQRAGIYTCPPNTCREDIRGSLRDMVDSFVNDFLTVNPK